MEQKQEQVEILKLSEELTLFEILHSLIMGLSFIDNPDGIIIKSKKLPNYHIVPNLGTFSTSLLNYVDIVKLDRNKTKTKSFQLTYDFVVIKQNKEETDIILLDCMSLTELIVMSALNKEIADMWEFDKPHFFIESYETNENSEEI